MGADYSTDNLRNRLSAVTLVEVLGPPYFATGHLPGAVNITPNRVAELAAVLLPDKNADIVIYGAQRHSPAADAVGRELSNLGYCNIATYLDGKQGWVEAGLPLVAEPD